MKSINTIYYVRHGENQANIKLEFSYRMLDYPLTERGFLQAKQTATFLQSKPIDVVFSSPLKRAEETAECIAGLKNLPVNVLEQFREVDVGQLDGQPFTRESWNLYWTIVQSWHEGDHNRSFPEGENYHMLLKRMREGLTQAITGRKGQTIVVVGHIGIFMATLQDWCQVEDLAKIRKAGIHNCSITTLKLELRKGQPRGWLVSSGCTSHLSGKATEFVSGIPEWLRK